MSDDSKRVVLRALKGFGRPMTPLRDGRREKGGRNTAVATRRMVCDIIR